MSGMIHDPEADKRSIMMQRPALCNGQAKGRSCVHYWVHVEKVESNNADNLRLGEIFRGCVLHASLVHEMTASQLATICNKYTPRKPPIWKRPLVVLGLADDLGKYDPAVEEYNPLTPEEIRELQKGSKEVTFDAVAGDHPAQENLEDFKDEVKKELTAEEAIEALGEDEDAEDQGIFEKKGES
jgi:hypothetical protein